MESIYFDGWREMEGYADEAFRSFREFFVGRDSTETVAIRLRRAVVHCHRMCIHHVYGKEYPYMTAKNALDARCRHGRILVGTSRDWM